MYLTYCEPQYRRSDDRELPVYCCARKYTGFFYNYFLGEIMQIAIYGKGGIGKSTGERQSVGGTGFLWKKGSADRL